MTRKQPAALAGERAKEALMILNPKGSTGGHLLFSSDREKLRPTMALAVEDLPSLIPGILSELFPEDSYCTLSRFKKPPAHRTPPGWATVRNVSHLTTAWVDIDGRNAPGGALDVVEILNDVNRMIAAKRIPRPSVIVESGRGVWLFWKLFAVEVVTTPGAVDTLTRINRRAAELLKGLGADPKAASVNSWARMPGSINSKSGREVFWHVVLQGREREPVQYTLAELSAAFAVAENPAPEVFTCLETQHAQPIATDREKNPVNVAKGHKGYKKRAANIAAALTHLASIRGGYREGMREKACHFLAVHHLWAGRSLPEIYRALTDPGLFTPAWSLSEIRKQVEAAPRFPRTTLAGVAMGCQYMADTLRVTRLESEAIADGIGITFPYIGQNQQPAPAKLSAAERRDQRRERVREIATTNPDLSERAILDLLISEGLQVSTQTVHADLVHWELNRTRPAPRTRPDPPAPLPFE